MLEDAGSALTVGVLSWSLPFGDDVDGDDEDGGGGEESSILLLSAFGGEGRNSMGGAGLGGTLPSTETRKGEG